MNIKEFMPYVSAEIENIKRYATEEEKDNLDIDLFYPQYRDSCIYGLLTGDCRSERALFLQKLSVKMIFTDFGDVDVLLSKDQYFIEKDQMDLRYISYTFYVTGDLTALEKYLMENFSIIHWRDIIGFIKGETSTLNLLN